MHMQDAYSAYLCRQRERRRCGITALSYHCHTHMAVRLTCDKEDINKLKKYFLRHGFFNIFVNLRSKTGTLCHTDGKAVRTVMSHIQDTTNNHKQKKR